jgi:60 kDa SS-A/Ro ribonucleoprotein
MPVRSSDPLARAGAPATPQGRPLPGREQDQVRNAAGGYVFRKDDWNRVEDFLILGVSGGTYYVSEDKLAADNLGWLEAAVTEDGPRLVQLIHVIATSRPPRAVKPRPCIFALALAYARGSADTRQAVKILFSDIVRTTDHLSMFLGYYKNLRAQPGRGGTGTKLVSGRALRTALSSWFEGDLDGVAIKALKGQQRKTPQGEDMRLRDVIRLAHPSGSTDGHKALIRWLAGRDPENEAREAVPVLDMYLQAQALTTERQAAAFIAEHRQFPWEFVPSRLRTREVWEVLAPRIGMTALIRNLALMTRLGVLTPLSPGTQLVAARLVNQAALAKARVHPADIWLAMRVYQSGRSQPSPRADVQTWTPVPAIMAALSDAFELSFLSAEPSGKKLLIAVDSSGSMMMHVYASGSLLGSAFQCGLTMAAILNRIEGDNAYVICVDTAMHPSEVTRQTKLGDIARMRHVGGGGTDLSIPYTWAAQQKLEADGFVILSDQETWAGRQHCVQAYAQYMRTMNRVPRNVAVAMCPAGYSVADPGDENTLQVAGLDASLPRLITGFVR